MIKKPKEIFEFDEDDKKLPMKHNFKEPFEIKRFNCKHNCLITEYFE